MSNAEIASLRERLGAVYDVRAAIDMLQWDQEVNMPPKAAPGRGQQLATLSALAHRMFTAPELGDDLQRLRDNAAKLEPDDAKLVSETLYDYERATKLPEWFVHEFAEEQSKGFNAWKEARDAADFKRFKPSLEKLLTLLKQKADYLGYVESPYDALLEEFERGMTASKLKAIFGGLATRQSDLVARIIKTGYQPDTPWLNQDWPASPQWAFSLDILRDIGYDFDAGRQDKSVHPFTTSFDLYDVRVTTRVNEKDLFGALMGSVHEGGHALYDQGYLERDRRCCLAQGISLGIHESQSRMWENVIACSLPFWRYYAPKLRAYFPGKLDAVSAEEIYAAINKVEPSFIRVEADECTYNLHIILRFEIEVALIEGDIAVADVPEVWNAKMKEYLGLDVPNDALGCLQDVHWSHGFMGYFPTYALGNLYAAQMVDTMQRDLPSLWHDIEAGNFRNVLEWLREKIHRHGRRKLAGELIRDISGSDLSAEPYLGYLRTKYGALYQLA